MRRLLLLAGLLLIVGAGLWKFAFAPRYEVRFPIGWRWSLSTVGTNLYADEKTGQFPENRKFPDDDDISVSDRVITATSNTAANAVNAVNLDDHYTAKDPTTGAVTWDFTYQAVVDPVTGKYKEDQYKNDYFLFPRSVAKTTYNIRNTSYPGLPVKFIQENVIEGLLTYEFAYTGSYNNRAAYPDQKLADGQDILCTALDLHYWVEPVTGEVVKYTEACNADAVVNAATSKPSNYISRWSGVVQSNDIASRVAEVTGLRNNLMLMTTYLPLILAVAGVILLIVGVISRKTSTTQAIAS
jgi:hypothetical protein